MSGGLSLIGRRRAGRVPALRSRSYDWPNGMETKWLI
jgi:hypothetical protein